MAENVITKVMSQANLAYFITALVNGQVRGKGLSSNDLTDELKNKLVALRDATEAEQDLTQVKQDLAELKCLIEDDNDCAINKLKEVFDFLASIEDTKTLDGIISGLNTQIAAAKKAGDDAASALEEYKTTTNQAINSINTALNGKASTGDLATAKQAAIDAAATAAAGLYQPKGDYIQEGDIVAMTDSEIDALLAEQ